VRWRQGAAFCPKDAAARILTYSVAINFADKHIEAPQSRKD
jgi:hypothetical protein